MPKNNIFLALSSQKRTISVGLLLGRSIIDKFFSNFAKYYSAK